MRQIRQMLRLVRDGVSARTLGAARSTIQDNLNRAKAAGLSWLLPGDLTDDVLEQRLFARAGTRRGFRRRAEPDWASLACELKRPGVNLMVLWEKYRRSRDADDLRHRPQRPVGCLVRRRFLRQADDLGDAIAHPSDSHDTEQSGIRNRTPLFRSIH